MAFMEEVAGVEPFDKFTTPRVDVVIQEELLANTIPVSPTTQAPRMMVASWQSWKKILSMWLIRFTVGFMLGGS